jgi:hypothetical protein
MNMFLVILHILLKQIAALVFFFLLVNVIGIYCEFNLQHQKM